MRYVNREPKRKNPIRKISKLISNKNWTSKKLYNPEFPKHNELKALFKKKQKFAQNTEAEQEQMQHGVARNHRYRRRERVLFLFQVALREGRALWFLWPFPRRPLYFFPADVRPRSSLCLWTGLQIQLILGSFRIALWAASTKIPSKYL